MDVADFVSTPPSRSNVSNPKQQHASRITRSRTSNITSMTMSNSDVRASMIPHQAFHCRKQPEALDKKLWLYQSISIAIKLNVVKHLSLHVRLTTAGTLEIKHVSARHCGQLWCCCSKWNIDICLSIVQMMAFAYHFIHIYIFFFCQNLFLSRFTRAADKGALDTAQRGSHWSPVPGLASWCNRLWTASSRAMCTATWWALGCTCHIRVASSQNS